MKSNLCQMWLTCTDKKEADKIARALLEKRLVACVRQIPVSSDYWWKGKIESSKEIMLLMESRLDLFDEVESEVARFHSYETFALEAVPVSKISSKAKKWLIDEQP
jgi:periplasmic divalent cation tolerance protein